MVALISILAFLVLTLALYWSSGRLDPAGLVMVLIALVLAMAGSCARWPERVETVARALMLSGLWFLMAGDLAAFWIEPMGTYPWRCIPLVPFLLRVPLTVLMLSYAWDHLLGPEQRVPPSRGTLLALGAALAAELVWLLGASLALYPGHGGGSVPLVAGLVLMALVLLYAWCRLLPPRWRFSALLGIAVVLGVWMIGEYGICIEALNLFPWRTVSLVPFFLSVAQIAGVLSFAVRRRLRPGWRFPAVLGMYVVFGAWTIRNLPSPPIDVWHLQQRASRLLLRGEDPYAADYPNIYGPTRFYGPRALRAGRVRSFPYPPLSLVMDLPGYLIGGDVRWSLLPALIAAAALMVATGRRLGLPAGHPAELAVIAFLCQPMGSSVLEMAWTEPFLAVAAAACGWAMVQGGSRRMGLALAAVISVKQYGILWLPAAWASRRLGWRAVVIGAGGAALIALPFLAWNPTAFWRGVIAFQVDQPFRADSLSVLAAVAKATGTQLPAALGFAAAAAVAGLVAWRAAPSLAHAALGGAAVFLAFFAFNKQAFLNYYWFASALLALATIAAIGESSTAPRAREPDLHPFQYGPDRHKLVSWLRL